MTNFKRTLKTTAILFTISTILIIAFSIINAYWDWSTQIEMTWSYWEMLKDAFLTYDYKYGDPTFGSSSLLIAIALPLSFIISMIFDMIIDAKENR